MLRRDVEVRQRVSAGIHRCEQALAQGARVHVHAPHPADAVDSGEGLEQLRELWTTGQVVAVAREILGDQIDFDDAVSGEALRFANEVIDRAAALFAAQGGDDAEGAGVVAAFSNLQIRRVLRHRVDAGQVAASDEGQVIGDLIAGLIVITIFPQNTNANKILTQFVCTAHV